EDAPRPPPPEHVLALDELVEIVAEGRDVNEPVDERLAQLDEHPERRDAADPAVPGGADLVLHELDLLQLHDLALRFQRDPLATGRLLGDGLEVGRDAPDAAERDVEDAVDDEVGIAPDG